jgi:hypothetical protein
VSDWRHRARCRDVEPEPRLLVRLLFSAVVAVLTITFIFVVVPLTVAYWAWVVEQGWSDLVTYAALGGPFVLALTVAIASNMDSENGS